MTIGNSRPLALCSVISQTARVARALLLVDVREERQPIDEAAERRLGLAAFVLARRRDELGEVLDARLRPPRCAPREGPAGSRSGRASCRWRSTPDPGAPSRSARRCRSRNTASDAAARPANAPFFEPANAAAPRASWPTAPAAGRRRAAADRRRRPAATLLERFHDALADAARRHVDHAPQADVVVRIDDEPHVGERVLDLLALVEPDAADDLVGDAFAHQRVLDRARLGVGAIEHGDHRVRRRRPARRGPSA